ncbi:hypothetical protein RFI_18359 [Reticulomyxa filosa]|uniref:CNNM transmembrane domain-containing protein n=1 Tax=Reticulomyxa filosa TaxID=46433 RepID=X6MZ52_RETFI|nr:hypothetical protein RFI_18359 [Reticulomyxa filosa]|eukprot:ETO18888.1 hypothetical protein RFI_18359 [Reticulomyxa filosa]
MAELIAKELVNLTLIHVSGASYYKDEQGYYYRQVLANSAGENNEEQIFKPLSASQLIGNTILCSVLVLFGGLTSGLNLSLLSIDPLKIKLMEQSSQPYDRKVIQNKNQSFSNLTSNVVKRIKPVIKNQHFLLVTLLVCNAAAMEALPIFLNEMMVDWMAIIISVTFAILAANPLKAGYHFAWIVLVLEVLTFPITYPLALLLDVMLKHDHSVLFTHQEMTNLFGIIAKDKEYADTKQEFEGDELLLLRFVRSVCALYRFWYYSVETEMVKWEDVIKLPYDLPLNSDGLEKIWECGFSRVPVYKEHEMDIVGICLVKDLLLEGDSQQVLGDCVRRKPVIMTPETTMIKALNIFQEKRTHFALITRDVDVVNECLDKSLTIPRSVRFLGAITLEDITEQLIQEEIEDEYAKKQKQQTDEKVDS